jgi:RNA polymerase sigma factor (sigma-70 family)
MPAAARPVRSRDHDEHDLVVLVQGARAGDRDAWTRLVQRFDRKLRQIARSYRLMPADVDDVVQTTWLNLFEAIDRIREPAAIGGWLATTTRRHALRRRQTHVREELADDPQPGECPDDNQPEASLLQLERRTVLAQALAKLPDRHRRLLIVLLNQPTLGYREIGELLSMPTGSIGPIRARSLRRLARDASLRALNDPLWS